MTDQLAPASPSIIDQITALTSQLPALLEAEVIGNLSLVSESLTRLNALAQTDAGLTLIQKNKIAEAAVALNTARNALTIAAEPYTKRGPKLVETAPAEAAAA